MIIFVLVVSLELMWGLYDYCWVLIVKVRHIIQLGWEGGALSCLCYRHNFYIVAPLRNINIEIYEMLQSRNIPTLGIHESCKRSIGIHN